MHAPHGPFGLIKRNIALDKIVIETMVFKFVFAEGAGKKSALVLQPLRFDDKSTFYFSLNKDHKKKPNQVYFVD